MAQVPYNGGTPEASPDTRVPDDYQHIQATPESFGAATARGLEKVGSGLEQASNNIFDIAQFKGKVNSDYEVNNFIEARNKALYGDPTKVTVGADGQPIRDMGYMGLQGRAPSDQREEALKGLNEARKQGRQNLTSPQEQLEYDTATRRIYAEAEGHIGQHAESQWKTWAAGVNKSGADLAINDIARHAADADPTARNNAFSDLTRLAVQEAQVNFNDDPAAKADAVARARQSGLKAWVEGVAATNDYVKAQRILEKNKDTAGVLYHPLMDELRAKANAQLGDQSVDRAIATAPATTFAPVVNDAISRAAATAGVDANTLRKFAAIESGGDPNAVTGSYRGLFQMSQAEFQKYGSGNIFDPADNAAAAANKIKAEGAAFAQRYGRPATTADLYLIHNQGAAGYAAHMADPDAPAWQNMLSTGEGQQKGAAWAKAAIWGNTPPKMRERFGSVDNISSRDFTSMWAARINSGQFNDVAAQAQKSEIYQRIQSDPSLANNPQALQHAFTVANQRITAKQIAENEDARAKKDAADKAAGDIMGKISRNEPVTAAEIYGNQAIPWEHRHALATIAAAASGETDVGSYGPGWLKAKQGILAGYDDPSRITDPGEILKRGPGMPDGDLTKKGVDDLLRTMQLAKKGVDEHGIERTKVAQIAYAKSLLSFDQEMLFPGAPPMRDRKGEQIFNSQFVPKFEAAYNKWVTVDKKDPMEFLSKKKMDELAQGLRPKSQMDMDRLAATGEATPAKQPEAAAPVPPPPEGANPVEWTKAVVVPPKKGDGTQYTRDTWARTLSLLLSDPEKYIPIFDASPFGKQAGYDGAALVAQLKKEDQTAPATASEPAPPEPKGIMGRIGERLGDEAGEAGRIFNLRQRMRDLQAEHEQAPAPSAIASAPAAAPLGRTEPD